MKTFLLGCLLFASVSTADVERIVTTVNSVMTPGAGIVIDVAQSLPGSCTTWQPGRVRTVASDDARFLNNISAIAMQAMATGAQVTLFTETGCTGPYSQKRLLGIALGTTAQW